MSKVDELIHELCPDGVERGTLGEVLTVQNGAAFKSTNFNNLGDGIPLIRVRDVNTGFSNTYYSGAYEDDYLVQNGDILIGMDGDFRVKKWAHGAALLNQRVARLTHITDQVIPGFVLHQLQPELLKIQNSTQSSTVKHLSSRTIANITIPLPPLEIQEEIVRILDQFVELDRELEKEIIAREEQRESVLERFFATLENFEMAPLSKVGQIITGRTPPAKNREDWGNELDFITPGDIEDGTRLIRKTNRALSETGAERMEKIVIPPESVCVVCIASLGKMGMNKNWAITNQQINSVKVSKGFDARYIFNALEYRRPELERLGGAGTTTMPIVNKTKFSQIEIPLPPLEVQEEIATKLDTFTEYIDNLKRERVLRQKQYEYYRDQLLDFEVKE